MKQIVNRDFTCTVRVYTDGGGAVEILDLYQTDQALVDFNLPFRDQKWGFVALQDTVGITPQQIEDYTTHVITHVSNVRDVGKWLGVPTNLLKDHDLSKFSPAEFLPYVRHHFGDKGDPDGYAMAWLHHIHNNLHHWQHWVFPNNYTPHGSTAVNGALPMPEPYVLEMVADWCSFEVAGGKAVATWLDENLGGMNLHPTTKKRLSDVLNKWEVGVDWELGRAWTWKQVAGVRVKRFS